MSFFYDDSGRTWHLWTDSQGRVHDEPTTAAAPQQPIEPSDEGADLEPQENTRQRRVHGSLEVPRA